MTWYSTFRSRLFDEWSRVGLPEASSDGREAWPRLRCPLLPGTAEVASTGAKSPRALDPQIVDTVYGFGVHVGQAFGRLYGVGGPQARARASFCGRFNLGISLFDFVCDEGSAEDFAALRRLPALERFYGAAAASTTPPAPPLAFLDRVAGDVLDTLRDEVGPPRTRPSGLWRAMFAMFEAQVRRSRARTGRLDDAAAMRSALRLSAAEPFRVMSEWMARSAPLSFARRASHLGRAVGDCFWLIDDAKDVWEDLRAGRWNRFLLDAKSVEPGLRLDRTSPFLEARLIEIWARERTVERAARQVVGRVAASLGALRVSGRRSQDAMRRLHAAMMGW